MHPELDEVNEICDVDQALPAISLKSQPILPSRKLMLPFVQGRRGVHFLHNIAQEGGGGGGVSKIEEFVWR